MTEIPAPSKTGRRSTPAWIALRAAAVACLVLAIDPVGVCAQQKDVPLPPPPAGTALKPPVPGEAPADVPGSAGGERCTGCHAQLAQGRVVHGALLKHSCTACHRAVTAEAGKCKSRTSSKWALVKTEPDLCYGCHARKDEQPSVHTVVQQGSCLACHEAHSSNFAGLISQPREKICVDCHDLDQLTSKPVKHAAVMEGRCLDCHDPHGGNLPKNVRAPSGNAFCLRCHDVKAPTGKGTPGPRYRIDLGKKVVHGAFKRIDCLGCHEGGHGSDNLKLLKKAPVDLCYGCHERKDKNRYPHSAVVVGDCVACHDPHSSDTPKLLAKPTIQETCFTCHEDDLTGRKVIHKPVEKGCDQCHDPHGAQNRNALKFGEGKATCYKCHKPVDTGKNKHPALERYGCTVCHDPHGAEHPAMLARTVNDTCITCHPEQKDGRHVTPLVAGGHVVGGNLNDPKRGGRDFSCASCHDPHGSDSPELLRLGATPMESCAWCHGDKSGTRPELKDVVSRARRTPSDPNTAPGAASSAAAAGSGAGGGSGDASPGRAGGADAPAGEPGGGR